MSVLMLTKTWSKMNWEASGTAVAEAVSKELGRLDPYLFVMDSGSDAGGF